MVRTGRKGRIEVVHGSMFGGKTEYLIARLRQEQAERRHVIAVKHAIDDRYAPDHLATHAGDRFDAIRLGSADEILAYCAQADVVAIDEGQFFHLALVPVVEKLADAGSLVLVAGITNDAWGRPFDPIPQLAEIADLEVLRQAPCRVCGVPAAFTQRMKPAESLHMVGGLGDYEPRCGEHFTPLAGPPEAR